MKINAYRLKRAQDLLVSARSISQEESHWYAISTISGTPHDPSNGALANTKSFIRANYTEDSQYFKDVNKINFHRLSKESHLSARSQLILLLESIVQEENENVHIASLLSAKEFPLSILIFFTALTVTLIVIWQVPDEYLASIFKSESIFIVRAILTLSLSIALLLIVAKQHWGAVLGAFVTAIVVLFNYAKPIVDKDDRPSKSNDSVNVTTRVPDAIKDIPKPRK